MACGRPFNSLSLDWIMRISSIRRPLITASVAVLLYSQGAAFAQMPHDHGQAPKEPCAEPMLRCALKVTPTFGPDGRLWLVWMAASRVWVAHSTDVGRSFSQPVSISAETRNLDRGPDARPKIAVDRDGRVFATGCDEFDAKPIEFENLVTTIRRVVANPK
jgi:hypothetical protein